MKFCLLLLFAFIANMFIFPTDALACACCVDPGFYSISTRKPDAYEIDELKKIRFKSANLYMDAAGEDNIKGINPISENYSLDGMLQNNLWKFNFKDDKGKAGTLSLTKPISMVAFMVDIHDRPSDSVETSVYKEWRFKYRVQSGSGIFQTGFAPATEYFLVLQGRGNGCTSAADFTHWRLEIFGKRANYAFFGELKK
jgi:hypothetical protein